MSIPVWVRIRVVEKNQKKVNLAIPLFLIWLLLLPFLMLAALLLTVAALVSWPWGYGKTLVAFIPMVLFLIWSMSGLYIQVEGHENRTLISIK